MLTNNQSHPAAIPSLPDAPYDELYRRSGVLWPARPGRMVRRIAEAFPSARCLDLGCGDGKNLVYLEQCGWTVDGVDVSPLALAGAAERIRQTGLTPRGSMLLDHCAAFRPTPQSYDVVLAYGLFHCLDERDLARTAARIAEALTPHGYLVFATFNDNLPVPSGHNTGTLYLRPPDRILEVFHSWTRIAVEYGTIEEDHRPAVGLHQHALTWGILQKC